MTSTITPISNVTCLNCYDSGCSTCFSEAEVLNLQQNNLSINSSVPTYTQCYNCTNCQSNYCSCKSCHQNLNTTTTGKVQIQNNVTITKQNRKKILDNMVNTLASTYLTNTHNSHLETFKILPHDIDHKI